GHTLLAGRAVPDRSRTGETSEAGCAPHTGLRGAVESRPGGRPGEIGEGRPALGVAAVAPEAACAPIPAVEAVLAGHAIGAPAACTALVAGGSEPGHEFDPINEVFLLAGGRPRSCNNRGKKMMPRGNRSVQFKSGRQRLNTRRSLCF